MTKWQEFKANIKNPPAERLAAIEYKSHFLGILGVLVTSSVLIFKGYWYVIFALIFSVGVSYSQGMQAYHKYKTIISYKPQENLKDINNEKSPTRRKTKIVQNILGRRIGWLTALISSALAAWIVDPFTMKWWGTAIIFLLMIVFYLSIHFLILYPIANIFFKKKLNKYKEVNKNAIIQKEKG